MSSNKPTIYDALREEHDTVDGLFADAKSAGTIETRTEVVDELYRQLVSHSTAEQVTVYDRVKSRFSEPELVDEAEQEHTEIEQRLKMLRNVDPTSDAWKRELDELHAHVKHHVKEEEHKFFSEMKDVLSDEDAAVMATDFQIAKQNALEELMVTVM